MKFSMLLCTFDGQLFGEYSTEVNWTNHIQPPSPAPRRTISVPFASTNFVPETERKDIVVVSDEDAFSLAGMTPSSLRGVEDIVENRTARKNA